MIYKIICYSILPNRKVEGVKTMAKCTRKRYMFEAELRGPLKNYVWVNQNLQVSEHLVMHVSDLGNNGQIGCP